MKNMRSVVYNDICDWTILEKRIIHDYTETEKPIKVIKVRIGTLICETIDINSHYTKNEMPIIRWITHNEYAHLLANAGTIIW